MNKSKKKVRQLIKNQALVHSDEYYAGRLRSIIGNSNWAIFYILLGARESGKSYAVMDFFLRCWKKKGIPFYWLRLNEESLKKMLRNNAEKFVDPDLYRKYDLQLETKGNVVYDHGKQMATLLALSTFANDKGVGYFDKDFLNDLAMRYNIALDEFQLENTQKRQGDIAYQFVNQMENIVRSTKNRMSIFLIGNTLEEASDILTLFDFIPEEFGRYRIKSKRAVLDYLPPSEAYKKRRKGSVGDILMGNQSNFTNEIPVDKSLVTRERRKKPTSIIKFTKQIRYTVWDGNIISPYKGEKIDTVIAMRPYIDVIYRVELRDQIISMFDMRAFLYSDLITFKKFQKEISLIKPRKN